jgi:hypothetical protein
LCNEFLTSKLRKREAGEITVGSFTEYKAACDLLVGQFRGNRLVDDLVANDFAALRAAMVRRWGPVRLANTVDRVKSVFKYGTDNGLIEKAVRHGVREAVRSRDASAPREGRRTGVASRAPPQADRRGPGATEGDGITWY